MPLSCILNSNQIDHSIFKKKQKNPRMHHPAVFDCISITSKKVTVLKFQDHGFNWSMWGRLLREDPMIQHLNLKNNYFLFLNSILMDFKPSSFFDVKWGILYVLIRGLLNSLIKRFKILFAF
jgi:hypothetical protein